MLILQQLSPVGTGGKPADSLEKVPAAKVWLYPTGSGGRFEMMESNHHWYYQDLKRDHDIFFLSHDGSVQASVGSFWTMLGGSEVNLERALVSADSSAMPPSWLCASACHISKPKFGQAQAHQESCPQRARVRKRPADKVVLCTMLKLMLSITVFFWARSLCMPNADESDRDDINLVRCITKNFLSTARLAFPQEG